MRQAELQRRQQTLLQERQMLQQQQQAQQGPQQQQQQPYMVQRPPPPQYPGVGMPGPRDQLAAVGVARPPQAAAGMVQFQQQQQQPLVQQQEGPMMNPAYRAVRAPVPPPAQHLANDARNFGTEVPVNANAPVEVHFYGHDPRTQVPTEMCLVGCVFCIVDYDRLYDSSEILKWKKVIMQRGGEVEEVYSPRCTHVICETQRSAVVQQALRESKRCVTVFWLNDVLTRKKLQAPWHALHFPSPYLENKPCKNQIICTSGFDTEERGLLKQMVLTTGAKFTTYLTRLNSLLITKKKEGLKYQKAQEWGIGIVNTQWLQDVMLGHYEALRLPTAPKYQQFEEIRLDYGLVPHLMAAWRIPIKLTEEVWKRFTASEAFKEAQKRKQETPAKSESTAPKQPRPAPEEEENIPVTVTTTLPDEKVPQVLLTGLKDVEDLKKAVLQLGGALAKSPKECTHLVTNRIQRTVKLLSAFGTAKFVVTPRWIKDSIANNGFVEERPYQVDDPDAEKTFGFSLDQVLQRTDRTPLFKGMIFFITPGVYPSPPILKEIVECSGGMVYLKKRPSLKQVTSVTQGGTKFIVISCDNDLHLCRDYMSKNINIYSAEFILTGVLRQCIESDAFLLS
uniref:PAX-interacting protein 1 n=1 Tax=Rhipicephalus appendiculatus TaxID=34631 RepID=A0A131Z066_RHIAP